MNIIRRPRHASIAASVLLLASACSKHSEPVAEATDVVAGIVTYPETTTLATLGDSTMLEVQLKDISAQQPQSTLMSVQRIRRPGRSPVHFSLAYPRDRIDSRHHYVIEARIFDPGQVLFATESAVAVITFGNPKIQDLRLKGVEHSSGAAPQEESSIFNGKLATAEEQSEYAAQFSGAHLVKIDEVRTSKDGKTNASYSFEGARLMSAKEESSEGSSRSTLDVSFDYRGHLDAIAQTRAGQPVKPDEGAAARIRNRAELLRSHALARHDAQGHKTDG